MNSGRVGAIVTSAVRIVLGYAAASLAGAVTAMLLTLVVTAAESDPELPVILAGALVTVPFVALFVGYLALVPGAVAIILAEALSVRRWPFFALAGTAAGAWFVAMAQASGGPSAQPGPVAAILGIGCVSGLAYWRAAGRHSGAFKAVSAPR